MTISELEEFFQSADLPEELQVNRSTKIANVRKFVESHLQVLRVNGDRPAFGAFRDRLMQVKSIIEEN